MRSKRVIILLIIALAMTQPHLSLPLADVAPTEVVLYAHTDPSATSVEGRVLALSSNSTSRQSADVRQGLSFSLVPPLSAPLYLRGRIDVYVWLRSQESIRGTLQVKILEVATNKSATEIRASSVTSPSSPTPYQVQFGLGTVDHTAATGSTIRLDIQFSPSRPIPVMLLWDDPSTPTRLVLRVESVPKMILRISDHSGRVATVFPANDTSLVGLIAETSVEDPFRGISIRDVSLSVVNSSGLFIVNNTLMNLTSQTESPFRLVYTLPFALHPGRFNITSTARDLANRTFTTTSEVAVTSFYSLTLVLVNLQKRPVPNLNLSLSAHNQLVDEAVTNLNGTATMRAPSSQFAGPLTLQIREKGMEIFSQTIELVSDHMLQLELPLRDWNVAVRLQTLNLPVPAAKVDTYFNGTLFASDETDSNGVAHFTSAPLGTYEIMVESPLGSKRFSNVSLSQDTTETALQLPFSESTLLVVGVLAIFAIFLAFAVDHRRTRTRRFGQVAELFGGTIPRPAVVMIIGPSGTGKSLLLQNILRDSLLLGRACAYVSSSEVPSRIRRQLAKMGLKLHEYEDKGRLLFVDAYSGEAKTVSAEKHSVPSTKDLTALGIQLTSCMEELGGTADIFFDSLTPVVVSGDPQRTLDFVRYYGARTTNSGSSFLYAITTAIGPELISRFEESSDCVLQMEKTSGPGKIRGRLLVKKARGLQHEPDWVGFKITSKGQMEFFSLPIEKE